MGNQSILTGTMGWSAEELRAAGEKILARPDGFREEFNQALLTTEPPLLIIKPPVIMSTSRAVFNEVGMIKTNYPADPALIALENLRSKMSEFDGRGDMVECLIEIKEAINQRAAKLYPELAKASLELAFVSESGYICAFRSHEKTKTTQT